LIDRGEHAEDRPHNGLNQRVGLCVIDAFFLDPEANRAADRIVNRNFRINLLDPIGAFFDESNVGLVAVAIEVKSVLAHDEKKRRF
jgi:hypothetical protein